MGSSCNPAPSLLHPSNHGSSSQTWQPLAILSHPSMHETRCSGTGWGSVLPAFACCGEESFLEMQKLPVQSPPHPHTDCTTLDTPFCGFPASLSKIPVNLGAHVTHHYSYHEAVLLQPSPVNCSISFLHSESLGNMGKQQE